MYTFNYQLIYSIDSPRKRKRNDFVMGKSIETYFLNGYNDYFLLLVAVIEMNDVEDHRISSFGCLMTHIEVNRNKVQHNDCPYTFDRKTLLL